MFGRYKRPTESEWQARALAAEAEVATCHASMERTREHLAGIELRFANRAALVSIVREGRLIKFMFLRNGQLIPVEAYSTMEDDVPGWRRALLDEVS